MGTFMLKRIWEAWKWGLSFLKGFGSLEMGPFMLKTIWEAWKCGNVW